MGKIRLRKTENNMYYAIKTLTNVSDEEAEEIRQKGRPIEQRSEAGKRRNPRNNKYQNIKKGRDHHAPGTVSRFARIDRSYCIPHPTIWPLK